MNIVRLIFLCLLLSFTASSHANDNGLPNAKPDKLGFSAERLARFTKHMQRYIDTGKLAGVQLAIARRGKLAYLESLGWADIEAQKPIQTDTIYRIHSMTKPLTSVAAMILVEQGNIKLHDPVARYIPAFADVQVFAGGTMAKPDLVKPAAPMTVQHLLAHTSGLSGMGYEEHPVGKFIEEQNPYRDNPNLTEFADRVAQIPLVQQPGAEFIYGPSTDILARVIEVASGMAFDDFLFSRVLRPLGMVDTHFIVPSDKEDRLAVPYETQQPSGKLVPVTRPDYVARWKKGSRFRSGGGGLVSTTADYLRFIQMLLNEGELDGARILAPKTVQLMSMPVVHHDETAFLNRSAPGYGFGLGFAVLEDVAAAGKPGSKGEYFWGGAADTYFFIDPAEQLIAVLMTQHYPAGTYQMREELQTFTYQALIERER